MKKIAAALTLSLALAALAGCADDDAGGGDATSGGGGLTVLAASSLTDVYEEMATKFEKANDAGVTFSFGSSTDLAEQVADGAPGDVLATADEASERLQEPGALVDMEDTDNGAGPAEPPTGEITALQSPVELDGDDAEPSAQGA